MSLPVTWPMRSAIFFALLVTLIYASQSYSQCLPRTKVRTLADSGYEWSIGGGAKRVSLSELLKSRRPITVDSFTPRLPDEVDPIIIDCHIRKIGVALSASGERTIALDLYNDRRKHVSAEVIDPRAQCIQGDSDLVNLFAGIYSYFEKFEERFPDPNKSRFLVYGYRFWQPGKKRSSAKLIVTPIVYFVNISKWPLRKTIR